ncbi:MAG TPA: M23 family metallopeptidase [Actinobacteria bacterium]|nr:M23 family metallopeptidase [Actinomycetota bacterium]
MNDLRRIRDRDTAGLSAQRLKKRLVGTAIIVLSFLGVYLIFQPQGSTGPASNRRLIIKQAVDEKTPLMKQEVFASVRGVDLVLPVPKNQIQGIGYHQAYNKRSPSLTSRFALMPGPSTQSVSQAAAAGQLVSFVMPSRGRGSALASSVDIALAAGTKIKSIVDGEVLSVESYMLYGEREDIRIEIKPDGQPGLKVCVIHIEQPLVQPGQRVEAGKTPLATVRPLGINSQINHFISDITDHLHIQINPIKQSGVSDAD